MLRLCRRGIVVSFIAVCSVAMVMTSPVSASLAHTKVVSEVPANFTPKVVLGTSGETVYAFAQVGQTMYVGGRFGQLRDKTGTTTFNRSNFAAFNTPHRRDPPARPAGQHTVQVIVAAPDKKSIYIGGDFSMMVASPPVASCASTSRPARSTPSSSPGSTAR